MRPLAGLTLGIAAVVLLPTFTSPAWGGWEIDEKYTTDTNGVAIRRDDLLARVVDRRFIQGNRLKRVLIDADGKPQYAYIYDFVADRLTEVDYPKSRYYAAPLGEWVRSEEIRGGIPLPNLPGDSLVANMCQGLLELRRSTQRDRIAGYEAVRYDSPVDGPPKRHLWIAEDVRLGQGIDHEKLARYGKGIWEPRCPRKADDPAVRHMREGYIMRSTGPNGSDGTEVFRVQERDIPDSEFQPPPGFVRRPIRESYGR